MATCVSIKLEERHETTPNKLFMDTKRPNMFKVRLFSFILQHYIPENLFNGLNYRLCGLKVFNATFASIPGKWSFTSTII